MNRSARFGPLLMAELQVAYFWVRLNEIPLDISI